MQGSDRPSLPVSQRLPRQIYWIIIALSVWLILSVWGFAANDTTGLVLAVVSLFILVVVALSLSLGHIARRHRRWRDDRAEPETLRDWLGRDFGSQSEELRGRAAAIQVLLPIMAVSFGMTLFAIVHHLDIFGV